MARLFLPLLLGLLLLSSLGDVTPQTMGATQQAALGLGFSSASIVRISTGVPIFERGDQLWAESFYNHTVAAVLWTPNQKTLMASRYLYPESPSILYVFRTNDTLGDWVIQTLDTGQSPFTIPLVSGENVTASVAGPALSGNQATYTASVEMGEAYSMQACLLGEAPHLASVRLPNVVSTGTLQVGRAGDSLSVTSNGTVVSPFSYEFEFYQSYSYRPPGSGALDTVQVEVGDSIPTLVTSSNNSTQNVRVNWLASPRQGRFDARAVIISAQGAQLIDFPILLTADGVVSLKGCAALASVSSSNLQITASLGISPSRWPRQLLLLYDWDGVESYGFSPISWGVSGADVRGGPWGAPLEGAKISITSQSAMGSASASGSQVFFSGPPNSFPAVVGMTVSLLGRSSNLQADFQEPFSSGDIEMPAGELSVGVVRDGANVRGALVNVVGPGGNLSDSTGSGPAVFVLLPGSYSFSASYQNRTVTGTAAVTAGAMVQVVADLTLTPYDPGVLLLSVAAALGLAANVLVWLVLPRRDFR